MKAYQRIIRETKKKPDIILADDAIKDAYVQPILKEEAEKIILNYEWLGNMGNTRHYYGIFFKQGRKILLAGVTCFGVPGATMGYIHYVGKRYAKRGIQLSRGACVPWAHRHTASKLISQSLKQIQQRDYKYVVAFSDPEAGEIGTVYQATNWHYTGRSMPSTSLYIKDRNEKILDTRDVYRYFRPRGIDMDVILNSDNMEDYLDMDQKNSRVGVNKLQEVIAQRGNLILKTGVPKHRYIFLLGSKKDKKHMMKTLCNKIQQYPKRDDYSEDLQYI
ncbi:unnamed protein product, partial [marine sediment metagenome]